MQWPGSAYLLSQCLCYNIYDSCSGFYFESGTLFVNNIGFFSLTHLTQSTQSMPWKQRDRPWMAKGSFARAILKCILALRFSVALVSENLLGADCVVWCVFKIALLNHACKWYLMHQTVPTPKSRNTKWSGRLSTVDIHIKVACFVTKGNNIFNMKAADLTLLVEGGKLCWAFPFSMASLP
jgi:hypothetical protein